MKRKHVHIDSVMVCCLSVCLIYSAFSDDLHRHFICLLVCRILFTCKWFVDVNNGGDWMGVSGHRRAQAIKRKTLFPRFWRKTVGECNSNLIEFTFQNCFFTFITKRKYSNTVILCFAISCPLWLRYN